MATNRKILGQVSPTANTLTDLFTVPNATQVDVTSVIVTNRAATAAKFRIAIAVKGAADDVKQYIAYDETVGGNKPYGITIDATMGAGDVMRVRADSANVSFTAFGKELTS